MKKYRKLRIIVIVMLLVCLAILTSGLVVYAESTIGINLIKYNNGDGTKSYVKDKLDSLYNSMPGESNTSCTASDITANDIGATVTGYKTYTPNDTSKSGTEWQIMYADNTNIYLITKWRVKNPTDSTLTLNPPVSGSVSSNYSNGKAMLTNGSLDSEITAWVDTSLWTDITSSNNNVKATMYMLDKNVWNSTYMDKTDGTGKARWAIGGPTLEMLTKSYAKYNYDSTNARYDEITANSYGYNYVFDKQRMLPTSTGWWNNSESYWLASPSGISAYAVLYVYSSNACVDHDRYDITYGFRPVVCLNSNVTLTKAANGSFTVN